ncbi:PEPxxWA-CTERM sorting domain-containing protein [Sphingomonas sp. RS6]
MRKALFAVALAAAAMLPQAASAQVVITDWSADPGFLTASKMVYKPTNDVDHNVSVGRFHMTGTENGSVIDFFSYCADAFHNLSKGSFEWADLSALTSNTTRQEQLVTLLTNSELLLGAESNAQVRKTISAATQLAVWEILSERKTWSYDTKKGDFYTTGGDTNAARTLANSYLAQIANGSWTAVAGYKVRVLFSANNQSQVVVTAVPEPATWLMLIGGFALVGGTLRRRRAATVRFA